MQWPNPLDCRLKLPTVKGREFELNDLINLYFHYLACHSVLLGSGKDWLAQHMGVGRNSGDRALSGKGLDPVVWQIDPAWWMHLQFGIFSIPASGPQLVQQRL